MNLAAPLLRHAGEQPTAIALVLEDRDVSYAELWQLISMASAALHAQGVQPGDRIGLCLGDHIEHIVMLFAVAATGATVLPMDHRWTGAEKAQVAAAFAARFVVHETAEAPVTGADNVDLSALLAPPAVTPATLQLDDLHAADNAPFIIALSSGTTGRPKGAVVAHRQMHERFVNQWSTLGFTPNDRFVSVTPLYFGAARSLCMGFLSLGATVVIDPPPHKPAGLVQAIRDSGANITFLVPTLMHRLLPLAQTDEYLFPRLDLLVFGGSIVHQPEALEFRRKLTPHLASYYATSEGGGISVLRGADFQQHGDTVGKAATQVVVEVVDARDRPVERGTTGRLRYRGPGVATAFLTDTGEPDPMSASGWFYPGDLASIDQDGFISLRGREKEMIIRGGVNVYPAEIEAALRDHPAVIDAAVVGWPSPGMGEEVAAFVAVDGNPDSDTLLDWCRARLAPYKVPREIFVRADLPRTRFGKIDKPALTKTLPTLPR